MTYKKTFLLLIVLLSFLPLQMSLADMKSFGQSISKPHIIWSLPIGETDTENDEVDGISVDPQGNTIVTGVFRGEIALGTHKFFSRGKGDIFLASYALNGNLNWARHIGGKGDDNIFDLTTDGAGNIVASGWFSDSISIDNTQLKSKGSQDMLLAKFTPGGQMIWAKSFGGTNGDGGNEVAVTAAGEISVSAMSEGDFVINDKTFPHGGGKRDAYLIRLKPDGTVRWIKPVNGPGTERIRAVAMDEDGTTFIGFQYKGLLSTDGRQIKSQGGWDGGIAKLNPAGRVEWLLPVGSPGTDNVRGLAVGPNRSVYAAGVIYEDATIIDQKYEIAGEKGDDFLLRLSEKGEQQWLVLMAGEGFGTGAEIQSDRRGVIASALIDGSVAVQKNGQILGKISTPAGLPTSYIAAFTTDGIPRFVYMAEPQNTKSGALGDVLSVSRDGKYLAQALRFRGDLQIGEYEMSTASTRDSAVIFYDINGN